MQVLYSRQGSSSAARSNGWTRVHGFRRFDQAESNLTGVYRSTLAVGLGSERVDQLRLRRT